MAHSTILNIPQEILQRIAFYAIHGSPLGPPKELHSLLLTCKTFKNYLSPQNAGELHWSVFGQQFDALAPQCRLGQPVARENTALELSRRFSALHIFKTASFDDHSLTEAFWIAYLMIEDQGTSQKNVQQLVRAGFPAFLDSYLLNHLYDGSAENNGWPVMTERNSLALALAWNLASHSSISGEDPNTRQEMIRLLEPIVFGASHYSIFCMPEDLFDPSCALHESVISSLASREVEYFGTVKKTAWIPSGALFAALLYFTRKEQITIKIPPHLTCKTRSEANLLGREGPCVEDIQHFSNNCRTQFASFPAVDVGISTSNLAASSEGSVLCQTSYKLGTLSGPWHGSNILPSLEEYAKWRLDSKLPEASSVQARKPLYFVFEEHYCYDPKAIVPQDDPANGMKNAWLPEDLQLTETQGGIDFSDSNGTFHTHYETFRHGQSFIHQRQLVDIIITGKTDDQYSAAWGASSKILGRVRLTDGLIILGKTSHQWGLETETDQQMLRGYVTSSQNFVGRMKGSTQGTESSSWEGVFSLNKSSQPSQLC
ncbi:hypothetical protein BYT27DRAFT_7247846 [Phlegmacium glaucopus]|nr:hypothetical protein BYT27DRAFT_7247846 [Phlegmacium glaucopus]